ncbi:MAG: hypothetical protein Q9214_000520, partial [Letrouitia sp. 1 TL-2023]
EAHDLLSDTPQIQDQGFRGRDVGGQDGEPIGRGLCCLVHIIFNVHNLFYNIVQDRLMFHTFGKEL